MVKVSIMIKRLFYLKRPHCVMTLSLSPTPPFRIGISGKQYAGKDVLTQILLKCLPDFKQQPLALAIKHAYCQQHGMSLDELEASKAQHRSGLIALGNWGREQDPDYWLQQVLNSPHSIIISDVRLQREFNQLFKAGAFLIRVNADRDIRAQRGTLTNETDATECELDHETRWHHVITNHGSEAELKQHALKILLPKLQHVGIC